MTSSDQHDPTPGTVSIVLPTLNGARYLRESLDSCLGQTYRDLELIVVDGGSTDGTREILASYADPRLVVLSQPPNSGRVPGALNIGFAHSRGAYLTWMQDDDIYEPTAIETMVRFLDEHADVGFVYTDYWWIDAHGQRTRRSEVGPIEELRARDCVGQCFLYRRAVYEDIGDYDPSYYMAEEVEYFLRISRRHRMQLLRTPPLYSHRWHPGSATVRSYGRYAALRVGARARRRWLRISWNEYRRILARSYLEEMFASHADGDLKHRRRTLWRALAYNPAALANPGVRAILVEVVLGQRRADVLRRSLHTMAGRP